MGPIICWTSNYNFNSRKLKLNYLKYCLPWTKYSIGLRIPSLSPTTTINGESMSVEVLSKTLVLPTLKRVNEAKTDVKPRKHDRNPLNFTPYIQLISFRSHTKIIVQHVTFSKHKQIVISITGPIF